MGVINLRNQWNLKVLGSFLPQQFTFWRKKSSMAFTPLFTICESSWNGVMSIGIDKFLGIRFILTKYPPAMVSFDDEFRIKSKMEMENDNILIVNHIKWSPWIKFSSRRLRIWATVAPSIIPLAFMQILSADSSIRISIESPAGFST